ncbi:MAG: DUF262 domain-containing protein, partial [Pseudomonadota bacterium]
MSEAVNLDALITRDDFLVTESSVQVGSSGKSDASRTDLVKGESFYQTLRKPDFQRETAAWSPEAICEFVSAFIEGDLIPSVILWQSPSRLSFVIDGAHRLSAIIAWLLDDYGDGVDSKIFYNYNIPDKQIKIAEKTRALIKKNIGTYEQLKAETAKPGSYPELANKARALAHSKIPLLWVNTQDPKKAERAFFTINQSAVQIDPTELKILNSRFKPNAIAARAVVRNATGHKYWEKFSDDGKKEIEFVAKNIYGLLYDPPLNAPIRTNELPIAGHGYGSQTLPLILDLVNIANGIAVTDPSKDKKRQTLSNDVEQVNEGETIKVIRGANKLSQVLTGTSASSLGLYPAVYFYSANGRHQPTTILSIACMLSELIDNDKLNDFCSVREQFEEFIIEYKAHINQLTSQYGSMDK